MNASEDAVGRAVAEAKKQSDMTRSGEAAKVTEQLLAAGQISRSAAGKILAALGHAPTHHNVSNAAPEREDFLSWVARALQAFFAAFGMLLTDMVHRKKASAARPMRKDRGAEGSKTTEEITHPAIGGVDSLLSFESLAETLKPLFNEYVWWFIAMVLVISGSVMGIREAWLRFEGILRPFTILFAFFAYHTLFLGLGIFLYRKSAGTGKMLLLIAAALIPLMFSIANTITRLSAEGGAAATAVALTLSLVTLLPLARRLGIPYLSAVFYLPVPFALAALSALAGTLPFVLPVLIVALSAALLAATGLARSESPFWRLTFASIGLIILLINLIAIPIPADDDLSRALRQLALMAALGQYALLMRSLDLARARFFTALEIVSYAGVALISLIASMPLAGGLGTTNPFSFRILALVLAIGIFLRASRDHNAAIHAVLFLSMCLLLRVTRIFTADYALQVFSFFIFPLLIPWLSRGFHENKQRLFLYWAVIAGLVGSLTQLSTPSAHWAAAATGLITALTLHRAAGFARTPFHYLSPIGLMVFVARLPLPAGIVIQPNEILFSLAVIYALGGVFFEKKAAPADENSPGHPLDDLSLVLGALAIIAVPVSAGTDAWAWELGSRTVAVRALIVLLLSWGFLLMRTVRDRSLMISTYANLALALGLMRLLQPRDYAEGAIFTVALAGLYYVGAALARTEIKPFLKELGRIFLFKLRLPLNATGINNIGLGFGLASVFLIFLELFIAAGWLGQPDLNARSQMLIAQGIFLLLLVLIFHFKSFTVFRLRGSLVLLYVLLLGVVFTAIINRLGRPLPPDAVALRMLLLFPLLALLTLAIKVYGLRYATYLGAGRQGEWYFSVPVTGVFGIALLIAYEILVVSQADFDRAFYFVPPTAYLALAIYPLILAHSVSRHFRHLFYLFVPVFLATVFAEQSFLGPQLTNIRTYGSWLPAYFTGNAAELAQNFSLVLTNDTSYLSFRQHIVLGLAAGVSLLALLALASRLSGAWTTVSQSLFSRNASGVSSESGLWTLGYTAIITLLSFQVAAVPPGVILIGVAILYLAARNVRISALILFTGGLMIVHGAAHLTAIYPPWPGPVLVAMAIGMILPVKKIAARLDLAEHFVAETSFLAGCLYIVAAFFYAATEGQGANALAAGWSIIQANSNYLARSDFYRSPALVLTLLFTAVFFRLALQRIEGLARVSLALMANLSLTAALSFAAFLMLSRFGLTFTFLLAAPYALSVILVMQIIVTFILNAIKLKDTDRYAGYFTGRDTVIVGAGIVFVALAVNLINPLPFSGIFMLTALVLYLFLNISAAFTSGKTRYVYIAQATIAGIYFSVRPILGINSAQMDAFFAFGYAFLLIGISLAAQRYNITVVSEPTRRFAAILPLIVALIIDNFRSFNTALFSLISSGLYLLLSRLGERNLFAALAAITLNATLFFLALAAGYDSSEFYALPAGLTIIFFATIFRDSLSPENQAHVRMIGGLVAYIPAAVHVTLRSGLAQSPVYSVAFGAICLFGILAGTIFHVRSYLFLGTLFLTLDIIANLVQEGLQNQFVGFVLLTMTGLLLIALLILYNLKKDQVHAAFMRLKQRFASWS